jgi:acyl dehydratase
MAKLTVESPAELPGYLGREIGISDWVEVTQDKINMFADASGDHHWTHVDAERAATETPFGGTIAHGTFALSMASRWMMELFELKGCRFVLNYGFNRVRLPAPLLAGSLVRARVSLTGLKELEHGNLEAVFTILVEIKGNKKPTCVADVVYHIYI